MIGTERTKDLRTQQKPEDVQAETPGTSLAAGDQKVLFMALAFTVVSMKGHDDAHSKVQVLQLTDLIEAFVNENIPHSTQQNRDVLTDALQALEAILEEGLNFSTEREAEKIIERVKAFCNSGLSSSRNISAANHRSSRAGVRCRRG